MHGVLIYLPLNNILWICRGIDALPDIAGMFENIPAKYNTESGTSTSLLTYENLLRKSDWWNSGVKEGVFRL